MDQLDLFEVSKPPVNLVKVKIFLNFPDWYNTQYDSWEEWYSRRHGCKPDYEAQTAFFKIATRFFSDTPYKSMDYDYWEPMKPGIGPRLPQF